MSTSASTSSFINHIRRHQIHLLTSQGKMNFNLSASFNVTRLLFKPSLCLPHHSVSTFNDLPIPLDKGLLKNGQKSNIRAVVLDKDDCFAYPDAREVYGPYRVQQLTRPPSGQLADRF